MALGQKLVVGGMSVGTVSPSYQRAREGSSIEGHGGGRYFGGSNQVNGQISYSCLIQSMKLSVFATLWASIFFGIVTRIPLYVNPLSVGIIDLSSLRIAASKVQNRRVKGPLI